MPATASDLAQIFRPLNEWDVKIAARLTEIWEKDSDSWTEKKKADFKTLCFDARITRSTMTPSSHKIHRKIQGRKATEAEYIVLTAMFGSDAIHRLSWGVEFRNRKGTRLVEAGVVARDVRRTLRRTWKSHTTATKTEAENVNQTPPKPEEPRLDWESAGALIQPKETNDNGTDLQPPNESVHKARSVKTGEGPQRQIDKSTVGDAGEMGGGVKSRTTVLRGIKAGAGLDGINDVAVRRRTRYGNITPGLEPASPKGGEATNKRAHMETGKEPRASRKRKRDRDERTSPEKSGKTADQPRKDVWETLQKCKPRKALKAQVDALEARCAAQEERMAKLEEAVCQKDEVLQTLRQQIDTVARYLARNA